MKHDGKRLNDSIRSGPKLQREIVDVLTRFRPAPVALSGDISERFLQVGLQDKDRPFHRFLWRDFDPSRDPDVYEFRRLLFVIHAHAQAHTETYPAAAESVDNSMYVDDVLDSSETIESAQDLRRQLSDLLGLAGFWLRKWSSNEPSVVASIPESDRLSAVEINKEKPSKTKTLGVLWDPQRDVFTFRVEPPDANKTPTKRNVLTAIVAVYDPLQFLSPFLVRAKILMQEIWRAIEGDFSCRRFEGLDWYDNLPSDLATKWKNWSTELSQLSHVAIPRCLRLANPNKMELHLFSDASKDAYASVAYLMCQYEDDSPISRLVASKSRVAPTKAMTIPRLELMGAILSGRLGQSLLKVLSVDRVTFWTDSENVWYWVRNHSRQFKPFVANHIAEIQRMTCPEQWRHVPGIQNPADLATRGQSAMELAKSAFWLVGPSFLKDVEISGSSAPSGRDETKDEDVEKTVAQTYMVQACVNLGVDPRRRWSSEDGRTLKTCR
jgi:hypothetical protein